MQHNPNTAIGSGKHLSIFKTIQQMQLPSQESTAL